jgi:hypothetical protein
MNEYNLENEEQFSIFEYVKENYIGLGLFIFAFLIIYFVDYINALNALIYMTPSPIPGLNNNNNNNNNNNKHILSNKKKLKKR